MCPEETGCVESFWKKLLILFLDSVRVDDLPTNELFRQVIEVRNSQQ